MTSIKNLTSGCLRQHLYQLALPIMGTSFVQMAYSFTDMAWLGRLSSEAVAAVGTISVFMWIAHSIAYFNKTGSEVTISQSIGRNRLDRARSYAAHNTTLSLIVSLIVASAFGLFAPELVDLYLLEPHVRSQALTYFYICLLGFPAIFLSATLFGIYNASGNSHIPFRILGMGLVCNMLLDPLLIHLCHWGVAGAAWATVVSEYITLGYFLYRIKVKDHLFDHFPLLTRLHLGQVWRIAKIGLPAASLNVLFALVSLYMGRLASSVGGHIGVATLTTGGQLEALTWNTSQGITTALCTIVGQNHAAGYHGRVRRIYSIALLHTLAIGLGGMLLFIFWGEGLFRLIVPDVATYQSGAIYMRITGYSQMFMMAEITTQGLFYGMGRSYLPAIISIVGNYLRIPLALYLLAQGWGLEGVWWAISLSSILKGIASLCALLWIRQLRTPIAEGV